MLNGVHSWFAEIIKHADLFFLNGSNLNIRFKIRIFPTCPLLFHCQIILMFNTRAAYILNFNTILLSLKMLWRIDGKEHDWAKILMRQSTIHRTNNDQFVRAILLCLSIPPIDNNTSYSINKTIAKVWLFFKCLTFLIDCVF